MKFDELIDYNSITRSVYEVYWNKIERIPEFALLKECNQTEKWHGEGNAWNHTRKVVDEAMSASLDFAFERDQKVLLFSALCHDLGKITTTKPDKDKPNVWHSYGHEFESARIVRELFADDILVDAVADIVENHMAVLTLLERKSPYEEIIKMVDKLGKNNFDILVALKRCDLNGSVQQDGILKQADYLKLDEIQQIADVLYDNDYVDFEPHINGNFNYQAYLNEHTEIMAKYQNLPKKAGYKRIWNYFGLFLDEESRDNLLALVSPMIPEGWRTICEHVTIAYNDGDHGKGERLLRNWFEDFEYHLRITEIGKSDKAFAVKVVFGNGNEIPTTSNFAHITIAVAPDAKPVESNAITEWQEANNALKVLGLKAEGILKEKYIKQKKVIFLDIDGVLNSEAYYKSKTAGAIDPECMARLNKIIKETKAKVVISSSWKLSMSSVNVEFKDAGFNGDIIDATPNYIFDEWRKDKSRGAEIADWLSDNKCDKYIIIDDREDFTEEQQQFFIHTDYLVGLTDDDVNLAINILNKDE